MWFIKLGSAVKGPFTEDQLASMLTRGEFSKSHLVSSDRQKWEQAGFLVELIERKITGKTRPTTASTSVHAQDSKNWYYSNDGQKVGPFTYSEVMGLIRDAVITAETNIYNNTTRSWILAREEPLLSGQFNSNRSNRGLLVALGASALGLVFITGLSFLGYKLFNKPTNTYADGTGANPPQTNDTNEKRDGASSKEQNKNQIHQSSSDQQSLMTEDMERKLTSTTGLVYLCTRCSIGSRVIDFTPLSSGTCFLVTKEGGVITNRHVVDFVPQLSSDENLAKLIAAEKAVCEKNGGAYSVGIYVFFGDLKWEMKVIQMSDHFDLAIGKIDRNRDCEYLPLAKSPNIRRTQKVYTIGFPGLASKAATSEDAALQDLLLKKTSISEMILPFEKVHTISDGSIERVTEFTNRVSVIQHTAKISQGNSGGPLVRADGTVIGINTFGMKDQKSLGVYLYSPEISQMRREIDEYIPGKVTWVD